LASIDTSSILLQKEVSDMKRIFISIALFGSLFVLITWISNLPVRGNDRDRDRDRNHESTENEEIQQGLAISPVTLNLEGKDVELVGLGSYIVNAQGGCNDCHTCPSYMPGHNPFPPPFGVSGDGEINAPTYLAGGVDFSIPPPVNVTVTSANLTPDAQGKPEGLTLEQFETALRTGHDQLDPQKRLLAVMPWPYYRHMTGHDLDAIYAFLSAIPPAETPKTHCAVAGQ
jgi:hypothetical protein